MDRAESARVQCCGRSSARPNAAATPERGWAGESLQAITATFRLAPLTDEQARSLLRRLETGEPEWVDALVRWAMGSPLALVVGANAPAGPAAARPFSPDVLDDLIERIAGEALDAREREALQAASIAWSVDAALLAAVLPERDGERSLERLIELDFVERSGDRAAVHPIVARAVSDQVQAENPRLFSSLTLRAASHLRDRAVDGDASALADLANLVRDPVLRDGLGPAFSERFYADRVRPGDLAALKSGVEAGRFGDDAALWPVIEPWLRRSPGECFVARSRSGRPLGVSVAIGARSLACASGEAAGLSGEAPAGTGALARPLIDFAAGLEQPERAVISPFQLALTGEPSEERTGLMRFMNAIAVLRCGVVNPRYDIVNGVGWTEREREIAARYGYEEVPELRRPIGGEEVRTWFADSGGSGLAGLIYHAIATENGLDLPARDGWPDLILVALESFHDDATLARLPVAPHGHVPAAAAQAVRNRVREIAARALATEPELHTIVEARYFTPGQNHDGAMRATFQSRSSYYRKLRRAREAIISAC